MNLDFQDFLNISFSSDYSEMPECAVGPGIHIWNIPFFTQLEETATEF